MHYPDAAIPLGCAWSSPFVRWQGSLSEVSSTDLAVAVTKRALAAHHVDPGQFGSIVLGWSVPQHQIFYGGPTLAARIGAPGITGPMISQACATGVACLHAAAAAVTTGADMQLVVATDRTSNGPTLLWPAPSRPAGSPVVENWVLDNFGCDPWANADMLAAAEAVTREMGASREQLDELTAMRWEQYETALADDRAFQRRYFVPVEITQGKRTLSLDSDEGIRPKTLEGIRPLRPAEPGGLHSFAAQTHPADGCAGAIVTTGANARRISGEGVAHILATGFARVDKSRMPRAPVPAALTALESAGRRITDVVAITTHNPFAVNDLWFAHETGVKLRDMNVHGCSLIFGHPQAPTGLRSVAELIETLRLRGGGLGLFTGCAAGDSAAAVVIEVTD